MKKQLQVIFGVFILIFLTNACNDGITDYPSLFTEEDQGISLFVPGDNYEFQEGAGLVGVVITSSSEQEGPVNVKFKITDITAQEGVDYKRETTENTVTIPAQENSTKVLFEILDDDFYSGNKTFEIELISTDVGKIATAESYYQKTTIVIVDNDCPLVLEELVGTYTAKENNGNANPYEVTIGMNTNGDGLLISNLWNVGGSTSLNLDDSNPADIKLSFINGEYLFTHSTYGDAGIYNSDAHSSTIKVCDKSFDLWFKVCVSAGCFGGGADGANQRVQLTKK